MRLLEKLPLLLAFVLMGTQALAGGLPPCDTWLKLTAEEKMEHLDAYSKLALPSDLVITDYEDRKSMKPVDRLFTQGMIDFLVDNSEVYNPDFPFKRRKPIESVRLIHDRNTGALLGGYVYLIRDLTGDAGQAWIEGYFTAAPFSFLGRGNGKDDSLTWSHY